jgi:tape measure domain-containing protein
VGKYTADIEIAVRGGQQIDGAIKSLNRLNNSINLVNRRAEILEGKGFNVASMENYSRAVSKAERALRKAAEGTDLERQAVNRLVTAMDAENKARSRRNFLIAQEVANRRRVVATADAGFGVQGPRAANVKAPRGPTSPIGGVRTGRTASAGPGMGSRLGGAISGSIIGGSFPLLFGQGAGAAAGGAVGGLVGGLLGPGGSFAGSLLGTLLGDIASKGQKVKELATDIGFTAEQTKRLQAAFTLAGRESDKFIESVQNIRGLSLSLDDQADSIQLVSKLTEVYGGKIEKVTNAFTSALESGKVTQATLNQLTSQGIPIQDELAKKYGVSRDKLLQMAKDGKISVQELVDVLVDMGNKGVAETGKTESGFEKLKKSVDSLGSALADLGGSLVRIFEGPFNFILDGLARITSTAAESINIISDLLKFSDPTKIETTAAIQAGRMPRGGKQSVIDVIGQDRLSQVEKAAGPGIFGLGTNVPKVLELLKQQPEFKVTETKIGKIDTPSQLPPSGTGSSGRKGPKPPEDRTAQLMDEYRAVEQRLSAENEIRDFLFEGKEISAANTEYAKALAAIDKERLDALRGANYASEKQLINALATLKQQGAALENEDKLRELDAKRAEQELQMQEAVRSSVQTFKDMRTEQELQVQYGKTYSRLLTEGVLPAEATRLANFDKLIAGKLKENEIQTEITKNELAQVGLSGIKIKELEDRLKLLGLIKEAITGEAATGPGAGPTGRERLQGEADRVRGELNTLTDPINAITTAAAGIGDAFGTSFKGIISGSMTAKEALANFFTSVADMFLDMAAQIITKMITMAILNAVLGVLPGGDPAKAGGDWIGAVGRLSPNAAGNAFGANGIIPFAKGGIVNSPTLFPFAKGTGLMGEAGPEAIMPLQRGADGKLGVLASGGGGGDVNVVVNVDAKGSSVEGDEQGANQLGRVISAAVQSELIKQQRPGGILAR